MAPREKHRVPSYLEPRVRALDTQIAALTNQVERLKDKFPETPESTRDQAKGEAAKVGCAQ